MDKMQKGFTLIELMIVVAIIAILAAIAIPAYQDYVIRSQVAEGTSLVFNAKTAVGEYYSNYGKLPTDNGSAAMASPSSIVGNYVASVTIVGGVINVLFGGTKVNAAITNDTLAFSPITAPDSTKWSCDTSANTVPNKYLPTICRP